MSLTPTEARSTREPSREGGGGAKVARGKECVGGLEIGASGTDFDSNTFCLGKVGALWTISLSKF